MMLYRDHWVNKMDNGSMHPATGLKGSVTAIVSHPITRDTAGKIPLMVFQNECNTYRR